MTQQQTLDANGWKVIKEQCQMLVKSGFLPPSIKTVEQAIAVALKGYELGLPIMNSFSHINIIQGKPTVSAELMMALIHKHCHGSIINFVKIEDDGCIIEACRPGGKTHTFKYDKEDAKAAGLLNRQQWKQYPRPMMRSRAVSEMARSLFPDAIMGCSYTPEELAPDQGHAYLPEDIPMPSLPPIHDAPIPVSESPNPSDNITPIVPPVKKTFDKNNKSHLSKLNQLLLKKGVDKESWNIIYDKMDGKCSKELDKVLTEHYNEVFSEGMDTGEDIPFAPVKKDSKESESLTKEG